MGFNQEMIIALGLDMVDVCLLKWLLDATGSSKMSHIQDGNDVYVWAQSNKVLSDYPILDIKQVALSRRFSKLYNLGLVKRKMKKALNGMKMYYCRTELFDSLLETTPKDNFKIISKDNSKIIPQDNFLYDNILKDNKLKDSYNKSIDKSMDNIITSTQTSAKKIDWFVENYRLYCKSFQNPRKLDDGRKRAILKLMKNFSKDEIIEVFTKIEQSDFLQENSSSWAKFSWFLKETNFIKILEGMYDNKKKNGVSAMDAKLKQSSLTKEQKERRKKNYENRKGRMY